MIGTESPCGEAAASGLLNTDTKSSRDVDTVILASCGASTTSSSSDMSASSEVDTRSTMVRWLSGRTVAT